MKHKLVILLAVLLSAGAFAPTTTRLRLASRFTLAITRITLTDHGIGGVAYAGIGSLATGNGVTTTTTEFGFTGIMRPATVTTRRTTGIPGITVITRRTSDFLRVVGSYRIMLNGVRHSHFPDSFDEKNNLRYFPDRFRSRRRWLFSIE